MVEFDEIILFLTFTFFPISQLFIIIESLIIPPEIIHSFPILAFGPITALPDILHFFPIITGPLIFTWLPIHVSSSTEILPSIMIVESFFPLNWGIKFYKIALFALMISSGVPVSFQ